MVELSHFRTDFIYKLNFFVGSATKWHIFWVPKPEFSLHLRDIVAIKTRQTIKRVDNLYTKHNDVIFHKLNYLSH